MKKGAMTSRNMLPLALMLLVAFAAHELRAATVAIDAGYNYNYWNPNNIDDVDYNTTGLNGGFVQLDLPLYRLIVNRPILRYEWTPGDRSQQEQIQRKLADSTSLEKFYEQILVHVPYKIMLLKYEKEVFIADLRLHENKTYFSFNNNAEYFSAGETISELVVFQEFSCHFLQIFGGAPPLFQDVYFGFSFGEYQKPYALPGGRYIYDAKFDYFSLDVGSACPKPDHLGFAFIYDVCISLGGGDIELSQGNSMNEMLQEDDLFLNSYAIKGMVGIQYEGERVAAGISLKGRGRMYNMNQSLNAASDSYPKSERIGSINKDSIFKAEASITIKF